MTLITKSMKGQKEMNRQSGVAAVEFAIVVFVLLLIFAGIVEFGRAFLYYDALAKGTRNAARLLSTTLPADLGTNVAATVQGILVDSATKAGITNFTAANVSYTCAPTACGSYSAPGDIAYVTVQASYTLSIGGLIRFILPSGAVQTTAATLAPHTTMKYMY